MDEYIKKHIITHFDVFRYNLRKYNSFGVLNLPSSTKIKVHKVGIYALYEYYFNIEDDISVTFSTVKSENESYYKAINNLSNINENGCVIIDTSNYYLLDGRMYNHVLDKADFFNYHISGLISSKITYDHYDLAMKLYDYMVQSRSKLDIDSQITVNWYKK